MKLIFMKLSCRSNYNPSRAVFRLCLILLAIAFTVGNAGAAEETAVAPSVANGTQLVSIDFNNVDIGVFIKFISDLTKKNFIVDDKVQGKVTIISPGKITVKEAYEVFLSVLEVYGYATVKSGEITKIVPSPDARSKNIRTRLEEESGVANDSIVTQIIPLRYADPNEIKALFTPLVSKSSVIQAYDPTNTLIVTDTASNIKRLMKILGAIDITGVGQQIAIIPVENASASKLVTLLQSIFKSSQPGRRPRKGAGSDLTAVADERTNTIVVLASEGEVDNIRKLVKSLDEEAPKGQGNINVYYLEHATAEDVVKVLMDIPQNTQTADPKQPGKPTQPVVSKNVRITADKATNSLIIMADQEDYAVLEAIIKKIDIPRSMVYIEALIMEVNASKNFTLGTEWIVGAETSYNGKDMVYGGGFKGDSSVGGLGANPLDTDAGLAPSFNSGFSMGIFGEAVEIAGISFPSISAVINAYKQDRDVRILSTPQILTTDNQEAKIYVGKNVPFRTTATVSQSSIGEVYNSYEYRDVGKTLKITPQISKDRMVRLALSLEVTDLESDADNLPTTLKRTIETTAICKDGNTVVLGGLIDDQGAATNIKTPCLGDIPGFGYLFGTKATAFRKSNLYVFLTPKVIQNSKEADKVAATKRSEIDHKREKNINLFEEDERESVEVPAPSDDQMQPPEPMEQNEGPGSPSSKFGDDTSMNEEVQSASTGSTSGEIQGYTLQVASVQEAEKANSMINELTQKGFAAYTVRVDVKGETWYRLRIGYYATKQDALSDMKKLRADQFDPILIKL